MSQRYGCYTCQRKVSHRKPQDGAGNVTDVTDVTPNRRGCTWRPSAPARARTRPTHTPPSDSVTSVTSEIITAQSCGFDVTGVV